jgi:carbamate kinase
MGPKVEAVARFVARGGSLAVITTLDLIDDALDGDVGTAVHPD